MEAEAAYAELIDRAKEAALLESCADLLSWDEETHMPPAGVAHRGDQLAWLTAEAHRRATDPRIGELLALVEGSSLAGDPESDAAVNVREIRRTFNRESRVPPSLAADLARATVTAQQEWLIARQETDFARFRPSLERIVMLRRSEADALGYRDEPYDALLDDFEPGMTTQDVVRLFATIRADLVPLVARIVDSEPRRRRSLRGEFPVERQRVLAGSLAAAMGFDFTGGRLDTSAHPFATHLGPGDCRLTVRYDPRELSEVVFGILHEGGHGLYDQGLDPARYGTPAGEPASQGMHESQARLWENRVGRSRPFWEFALPLIRAQFPGSLARVSASQAYTAANVVRRSSNRIRADEVTYNLHIIIRFELERQLIAGSLLVDDLPDAWNDLYQQYLGVIPADDADGCLQDSHWAAGLIGYFPTYTLGDIYAAQLYTAAASAISDLEQQIARGDFHALRDWLRVNIHRAGRRYPAPELVARATGGPPDARVLIDLLSKKYTPGTS